MTSKLSENETLLNKAVVWNATAGSPCDVSVYLITELIALLNGVCDPDTGILSLQDEVYLMAIQSTARFKMFQLAVAELQKVRDVRLIEELRGGVVDCVLTRECASG